MEVEITIHFYKNNRKSDCTVENAIFNYKNSISIAINPIAQKDRDEDSENNSTDISNQQQVSPNSTIEVQLKAEENDNDKTPMDPPIDRELTDSTDPIVLDANGLPGPWPNREDMNNFYCRICDLCYSGKRNLSLHYNIKHNMTLQKRIRTTRILPDINDPNYYCLVCEKIFTRKDGYHRHLQHTHKMTIPLPGPKIFVPHIKPNFQVTDEYCAECENTYPVKANYQKHLQEAHHMHLERRAELIPEDLDLYCTVCKKGYSKSSNYRHHMKQFHNTTLPHVREVKINPYLKPDINDPSLYCNSCEKTYSQVASFRRHLRFVHKMTHPTALPRKRKICNSDIMPDINDPNTHCDACNKTFTRRDNFRTHLRNTHNLIGLPLPTQPETTINPYLTMPDVV